MGNDFNLRESLTQLAIYCDCLEPMHRFSTAGEQSEVEAQKQESISIASISLEDDKFLNYAAKSPKKLQRKVTFEVKNPDAPDVSEVSQVNNLPEIIDLSSLLPAELHDAVPISRASQPSLRQPRSWNNSNMSIVKLSASTPVQADDDLDVVFVDDYFLEGEEREYRGRREKQ